MIIQALNQTLIITEGRVLGYAESGDPKGRPLFLFHGLNSSRLEVNIAHEAMLRAGIRCIGIDRPGMGLSTFQEGRTVLSFIEDVEALADHLNIDKFLLPCLYPSLNVSTKAFFADAIFIRFLSTSSSANIMPSRKRSSFAVF